MTKFADIADFDEDKRIDIIGHRAMVHKEKVAFIVEEDEQEKKERYIRKLKERFPGIRIIEEGKGPIPNCVWVKVGPPEN